MKIPNIVEILTQNSGEVEFFTPLFVIEGGRQVMGGIDLDPASCKAANRYVKAAEYFTKKDDGLTQRWRGRVFMNHPFGIAERCCYPKITGKPCNKKICDRRGYHMRKDYPGNAGWISKLTTSYEKGAVTAAVGICFASTGEGWFQPLMRYPLCFLYPRTNYRNAAGETVKGVLKASVVYYMGPNIARFREVFKPHGTVKI